MPDALTARSNGWRIPSMPDDVRAETMRPALAAFLSCRKRLDWDSFMQLILRQRCADAHIRMNGVLSSEHLFQP